MSECYISAVLPVYNEEENLPRLHERLTKVFGELNKPYEIIFVNDGSADRSMDIIRELALTDTHVRGVNLSRNFGHQICLTAGLDHARGEVVAMMDADLQDPPELLPRMLKRYEQGYDVVYAQRMKREGETFFKKLTAAAFYRLLKFCTRIEIPLDTGDFRIISRRALESVLELREHNRFLRGLFTWVGYKQIGVKYNRPKRFAGETKYPLRKMVRFAMDGITSFSAAPLQAGIWLGFISAMLGFVYALRVLWDWLSGSTVPGWASLAILVLFFGGVQLISMGIMGEYIGRIFDEVKRRPLYFTREEVGFDADDLDRIRRRRAR
ncbi:glycosyltransferase [Candidatus Poribacteria bacterium]|nr:glycosyltransferase [Candidatus Poribacteria bacterium]